MTKNNDKSDDRPEVIQLLNNIKSNLVRLRELQLRCDDDGADGVYRFYHASFKVYNRLQPLTENLVSLFRDLDPKDDKGLDDFFGLIVKDGTNRVFQRPHNEDWPSHTRPIVEAYFHARYFLDQLILASDLEYPPCLLPEGWAAVLTLFCLR
jgi:hypothetical protein